jgi:hypothetical protein
MRFSRKKTHFSCFAASFGEGQGLDAKFFIPQEML